MKILPLVVLFACLAWQVSARAQDDTEPRAPTRGLLKRGPLSKGKTTTTTTQAPQEEAEYEEEVEYADGEGQEPSTEAPASSTEGKKLVGNGVRPFRSNTDLLEALKRRRAQAAEAKLHGHNAPAAPAQSQSQDAPVEAPVKAYNNINRNRASTVKEEIKQPTNDVKRTKTPDKRKTTTQNYSKRRNTQNRQTEPSDIETTTVSKQSRPQNKYRKATESMSGLLYSRDKKRFNKETSEDSPSASKPSRNRFSRPSSRAAAEPEPEEQPETPAPAPVRVGRTFRRN